MKGAIGDYSRVELPSGLHQAVDVPEVFDERFKTGEVSALDSQGCSTMPLSRFLLDASGAELERHHWVQDVPTATVTARRFPRRRTELVHGDKDLYWIQQNRKYLGWSAGIKDILWSEFPDAAAEIFDEGVNYESILDIGEAMNSASEEARRTHTVAGAHLLQRHLGDFDAVDSVLRESMHRQGVQVVYGGQDYADYMRENSVRAGDMMISRRTYNGRIPTEFIRSILPIGSYEQYRLLGLEPDNQ